MSVPKDARFRLMDLMVLTGAVAAGLALARLLQPGLGLQDSLNTVYDWVLATAPSVSFCMIAILALRLRRPRPPLWRLLRQPGILACFVTPIALVWTSLAITPLLLNLRSTPGQPSHILAESTATGPAHWILVAWITLALTGQWRPKREWFDRAGIVLGAYMILAFSIGRLVFQYIIMVLNIIL